MYDMFVVVGWKHDVPFGRKHASRTSIGISPCLIGKRKEKKQAGSVS
jgi:hypothetical protein